MFGDDIPKNSLKKYYIGICITENEYKKIVKNIISLNYLRNLPFDPDGFYDYDTQQEIMNNADDDNITTPEYIENLNIFKTVENYLYDVNKKYHINNSSTTNLLNNLLSNVPCETDIIKYVIMPYSIDDEYIKSGFNIIYLDEDDFRDLNYRNKTKYIFRYKKNDLNQIKYDYAHPIFLGYSVDTDTDNTFKDLYNEYLLNKNPCQSFDEYLKYTNKDTYFNDIFIENSNKLRIILGDSFTKSHIRVLFDTTI